MFRTFTVGRSGCADIEISHDTVSRQHLEITLSPQGNYYLVDRLSTGGTYVWRNDNWQRLQQGYVKADEYIALGKKKVLMSEITQEIEGYLTDRKVNELIGFEPVSVKPRRNAGTGEVVK